MVLQAIRRAAEAQSLGSQKMAEYRSNIEMMTNKIQEYGTLAGMPNTDQKVLDSVRLAAEGHLTAAFDAIDFVRLRHADDRKFADEVLNKLKAGQ